MFNMSMIIVTLTSIIQFTPEQQMSYEEIVNLDPQTVKRIRNEASIVIQAAWKDYTARKLVAPANATKEDKKKIFNTKFNARIMLVAIAKRYKYKRLNVTNANPQLSNIIFDLKENVNTFLEEGMRNLNVYKTEITKQVGEMRQNQFKMDAKILKMYDVTMRLNSFLVACNRGEPVEGSKFNTSKNLYTHRRAKMTINAVKEYMLLFDDAREPADKFYEAYRPAEKVAGPSNLDKKNLELEDHLNQDQGDDNINNYINIEIGEEQPSKQVTTSKDKTKKTEKTQKTHKTDETPLEGEEEYQQSGEEEVHGEEEAREETEKVVKRQATKTSESQGSKRSKRGKKKK